MILLDDGETRVDGGGRGTATASTGALGGVASAGRLGLGIEVGAADKVEAGHGVRDAVLPMSIDLHLFHLQHFC